MNKRQRNKKPIPLNLRELVRRAICWSKFEKQHIVHSGVCIIRSGEIGDILTSDENGIPRWKKEIKNDKT